MCFCTMIAGISSLSISYKVNFQLYYSFHGMPHHLHVMMYTNSLYFILSFRYVTSYISSSGEYSIHVPCIRKSCVRNLMMYRPTVCQKVTAGLRCLIGSITDERSLLWGNMIVFHILSFHRGSVISTMATVKWEYLAEINFHLLNHPKVFTHLMLTIQ